MYVIIYSSQELIREICLFHDWIFNSVNILIDICFNLLQELCCKKIKETIERLIIKK